MQAYRGVLSCGLVANAWICPASAVGWKFEAKGMFLPGGYYRGGVATNVLDVRVEAGYIRLV